MNELETIAVLAGALAVVSRLPAVFWPSKFKKFVVAFWKKPQKPLAALFLVVSLLVFFLVFSRLPVSSVVAPIFAFATLACAWMLQDQHFGKAVSQLIYKKSDNWIRVRGLVSAAIGLLVIYFVLRAA